jgi:hypothetical protein
MSAEFFTVHVCCLRNRTLIPRYIKLILAFAISGLLHHFASGQAPWRESHATSYFLLQSGGVMVKDGVQEIYRHCGGKPKWWSKAVGYIWTTMFQAYTASRWIAQNAEFIRPGVDNLVPFSVLRFLASYMYE